MSAALAILVAILGLGGAGLVWRRAVRPAEASWRTATYAVLAGGLGALLTSYAELLVLDWTELDFDARRAGAAGALMAVFLLAEPLEEAVKVLVIWPLYRAGRLARPRLGVAYAVSAGAGFAAVEAGWQLFTAGASPMIGLRVLLGTFAHCFFAGAWGYALGAGRAPGRWFSLTWLGSVLLHGLYSYIVWGRGPAYLAATLPMLGFMAVGGFLVLRDLRVDPEPESARQSEAPGLGVVRRALRANERPIMLRWVVVGAFVTIGLVLVLGLAGAWLGRRLGIDFALADEFDLRSSGPIVLLGTAVLLAFPIAGYLVARASGSLSVLEPALSTLLAVVALVAYFALTAPVAVLFAFALAPVAVGLSCGGAWVGLER